MSNTREFLAAGIEAHGRQTVVTSLGEQVHEALDSPSRCCSTLMFIDMKSAVSDTAKKSRSFSLIISFANIISTAVKGRCGWSRLACSFEICALLSSNLAFTLFNSFDILATSFLSESARAKEKEDIATNTGAGRGQTATMIELVGTPKTKGVILAGTFLSVSIFNKCCAASLEGASPFAPMTIPSSPISSMLLLFKIIQPALRKSLDNNSEVIRAGLLLDTRRSSTLIPANGLKAAINESSSPRFIGSTDISKFVRLSFRRASAFASCVLVSLSCISSCFAANSFFEVRSFACAASRVAFSALSSADFPCSYNSAFCLSKMIFPSWLPLNSTVSPPTTINQKIAPQISIENSWRLHQPRKHSFFSLCRKIFSPISIPSPATPIITSQVPKSANDSEKLSNAASSALIEESERRSKWRFYLTISALLVIVVLKFVLAFQIRNNRKK